MRTLTKRERAEQDIEDCFVFIGEQDLDGRFTWCGWQGVCLGCPHVEGEAYCPECTGRTLVSDDAAERQERAGTSLPSLVSLFAERGRRDPPTPILRSRME